MTDVLAPAGGVAVIAVRAVTLAAITVAVGAVTFYWFVLRRWAGELSGSALRLAPLAATAGASASMALVLAAPVQLGLQALALVDPGDPVGPMAANVLDTGWGRALLFQGVVALTAVVAFLAAAKGRRWGWPLALGAALALSSSLAAMGHAGAAPRYLPISMVDAWLHVVSAGGWAGALFMLALSAVALRRSGDGGEVLAGAITAFHGVAIVSTAVLLATGIVSVLLIVPHLGDLLASAYGAILFVKIALAGAAAALGAYHSRVAAQRAQLRGVASVYRSLLAEAAFLGIVIGVTAVFAGSPLPGAN